MSEGPYHQIIKETIFKIAVESGKHKTVHKEKKIPLPHPTRSIQPIMYLPEIWIKSRYGKFIFEILDSQGRDTNLIIADIIQAYLVDEVRKVFFIAKNPEEYELAKRLTNIIGARLEENGYKKTHLPLVTVYLIEKEDLNHERLYSVLKKFAKEDGWG